MPPPPPAGAHKQLRAGGQLYIVAQEQVPVGRMLALCGAYAHVTATTSPDKRFITWCATAAGKAKVGKGGESKGKKDGKRSSGDKRKSIEDAVVEPEPDTQSKTKEKKEKKEKRAERDVSKLSKKRKAEQATETQPKTKKAKSESGKEQKDNAKGADGVSATEKASSKAERRRGEVAEETVHDAGDGKKSKTSKKIKTTGEGQGDAPKTEAEKKKKTKSTKKKTKKQ